MLAPGMALGLASSVPLGMGIMRLFLREKYADYAQFGERLYGLRANRVGVFLGALMAVPSLIFMVLAADCFAARTENHIVISRFWSLGAERRSYADVREVRAVESFRAPNGKIVRRPFHEIEFIDGSVWSPKQLGRDPEKAEEIEFVRLIAVRSGKSIVRHLIRPE